ncbi:MAG: hypothetical protein AABZ47_10450 [Planctomycetota bacterium]
MTAKLLATGVFIGLILLSEVSAAEPNLTPTPGPSKSRYSSGDSTSSNLQSRDNGLTWRGTISVDFDPIAISSWKLNLMFRGQLEAENERTTITFPIRTSVLHDLNLDQRFELLSQGITLQGALELSSENEYVVLVNPVLLPSDAGRWHLVDSNATEAGLVWLELVVSEIDLSPADGTILVAGEWVLADHAIAALRLSHQPQSILGSAVISLQADNESPVGEDAPDVEAPAVDGGTIASAAGPDIIVGNLDIVMRWGKVGDVTGYSVGTISCNIGTARADWIINGPNAAKHPVIAQNMYRLKDGRFEQVGMSWLKHGFFAVNGTLCSQPGACAGSLDGTFLGVGCSDPYDANLNGQISNLGPRHQVNPTTGVFPYPPTRPNNCGTSPICRRIQVRDADLDPESNVGALYFMEAHYVHSGDAAAGNQDNNASYRPFHVSEVAPGVYTAGLTDTIQRQKPAIQAWADTDPAARVINVDIPNDRRILLGYKITEMEDGWYHYEYAVQNLNSHRAAGSFTVPIPAGTQTRDIGFHDINTHSADNTPGSWFDSTDWTSSLESEQLTWRCPSHATNPDANALRWGSLYNFRFDARRPPHIGNLNIGMFIPGTPESVNVVASVPSDLIEIVVSDPPHEAIDARQPVDPASGQPQGWNIVDLTFNVATGEFLASDFTITQDGGGPPTLEIIDAQSVAEKLMRLVLSGPIAPVARTTFTHTPSGAHVRLNNLPGDVNGDGITTPADVEALIELIYTGTENLPPWSTDLDRSGSLNLVDIIRGVDILNGADALDAYNGAALPPP